MVKPDGSQPCPVLRHFQFLCTVSLPSIYFLCRLEEIGGTWEKQRRTAFWVCSIPKERGEGYKTCVTNDLARMLARRA